MTQVLNIIGAGRVGQTFLGLAHRVGLQVQDVASGSRASASAAAERIGAGNACEIGEMRPADLWLLTVPDGQITQVAATLAATGLPPSLAVHCSGFHPATIMAPLHDAGWSLASLHPVRSFADPQAAIADFPGTPCGVEGDGPALHATTDFARRVGGRPFPIRSEAKALYHAAAVFSNNFTTLLQAIADEAWAEAGVPEDVARDLQAGLLRNALENVAALGPQEALTGPAARGDTEVIAAQGAQVAAWHPEAGALYETCSTLAARLKRTGKTRNTS